MIGAIIGDIIGSRFEFNNKKTKDFELFAKECRPTDDSLMTLAIAKAIMEAEKIIRDSRDEDYYTHIEKMTVLCMQELGRKYPDAGFGGMFFKWLFSDNPMPYNSFGNGAAMRISPVGFAAKTEEEACKLSKIVTGVTHNHKEGLKGAEAVAVAIYMARHGASKDEIKKKIEENYYDLDFRLDDIRPSYQFDVTCQGSVPQAIKAFLESISFEDAIRNAVSLGGDSDTIGAITGGIAEAYYGVPGEFKEKALSYLTEDLRLIVKEWYDFIA